MTTRQANQAIKEASEEGKYAYYTNPKLVTYGTYGYNGTRVVRARTKKGVQQVLELWSGEWVDCLFSDLFTQ